MAITDGPLWGGDMLSGRNQRAAVAIRDNTSPFENWGTRIFTWPYLSRSYGEVYYFTETLLRDKEEEFTSALRTALENHEHVDVFLLAHGNEYYLWVEEVDKDLRARVRLVYNTGCKGAAQGEVWLNLGAETYIGHPGKSYSPIFYFYFLRRWTRGYNVGEALEQSNTLMRRLLFRTVYFSHGKAVAEKIWQDSEAVLFGRGDISIGD